MNKNNIYYYFLLFLQTSLLFTGCEKSENPIPAGDYAKGVFITNEGRFNGNDGEISFYDPATKTVRNKLFNTVNQFTLGDVVQSMLIHEDKGYIVVNNSHKIEVVNSHTLQSLATITALQLPRYMVVQNNKGYVTEWVSFTDTGRVAIIDLNTNTVTNTIPVGNLPEQLTIVNNQLYVANSADNTVTVIDLSSESVAGTIEAGNNPGYISQDKNGNVWILSGFTSANSTLVRLNPSAPAAQTVFTFSGSGASNLVINGSKDKLYYSFDNAVYAIDIDADALSTTPVINRNFYGMGIAPDANILYGTFVPGFTSDGRVIRYNLTTGAALDSVNVSVAPNSFVFK